MVGWGILRFIGFIGGTLSGISAVYFRLTTLDELRGKGQDQFDGYFERIALLLVLFLMALVVDCASLCDVG